LDSDYHTLSHELTPVIKLSMVHVHMSYGLCTIILILSITIIFARLWAILSHETHLSYCDTNYCLRLPGRLVAHVIRCIYQDIITILTRLCIIVYYLITLIIDPRECLSTHFQDNSKNSSVLYHQIFIITYLCAYKPTTTTLVKLYYWIHH